MKKIIVSKYCGFCSGVRRCISLVENELKLGNEVYSTGELLHNFYEMKRLKELGLKVIEDINELQDMKEKNITLVIRTHGIEKQFYEELNKRENIRIVDGTCPTVKKLQSIVEQYSAKGFNVIIFGNSQHPEIKALVTYVDRKVSYQVINSEEDINKIVKAEPLILVSQTTKQEKKYQQIIDILKDMCKEIKIFNTVCKETILREKDAEEIAKKVDLMLIIGSKISSNTKKLLDVSKINNNNVFLVENEDDLLGLDLSPYSKIGIVSGASTPMWLVEKIINNISLVNV